VQHRHLCCGVVQCIATAGRSRPILRRTNGEDVSKGMSQGQLTLNACLQALNCRYLVLAHQHTHPTPAAARGPCMRPKSTSTQQLGVICNFRQPNSCSLHLQAAPAQRKAPLHTRPTGGSSAPSSTHFAALLLAQLLYSGQISCAEPAISAADLRQQSLITVFAGNRTA
jgi:hypothetical protein